MVEHDSQDYHGEWNALVAHANRQPVTDSSQADGWCWPIFNQLIMGAGQTELLVPGTGER